MTSSGRTIGRYRIVDKIGEGGMGVVYRAQDATLAREVAIKVLRSELGRHPERLRRFSQEARAASALNHPNIVTVHDAGEFEDGPFLVMELVEGESLRAMARRGTMPPARLLDIGIQAAAALTRAHESGITHRDLKPENILVRPDGYVKVLDFGLAKLKEKEPPPAGASAAPTIELGLTSEGTVVGTPAYMSPEQATGRAVDGRSDIFSLAMVLFECWQGKHPFTRGSQLDTLHAIAHDRLPAVHYPPGSLEWGLARVLEKSLEKEPDERYQTMKDLGIDLRRLKQESETGRLASTAIVSPARSGRRPVIYAIGALAIVAMLIAGGLLLFRSRKPAAPPRIEYTQLTNFADSATSPALSKDGRMLAFIRGPETFSGPGEIYVKLLPDGDAVQLTHDGLNKMSPAFDPGGTRIAYTESSAEGMGQGSTWTVPVMGGEPARLLARAEALSFIESPGGPPRVLFSEPGEGVHLLIVTAAQNRSDSRIVYAPPRKQAMAHRSYLSPDGKNVLVVEMDGAWLPCRLAPFEGNAPARPVGPSPGQCTTAAWSPDGEWMYFSADAGDGYHIWRQRFPDGAPEQITSAVAEEEGIAFFPDGRSFVTSVGTRLSTLWVHDGRGGRQITSQGYASLPQFSVDGKKLYYLLRSHSNRRFVSGELWVADLEAGRQQRLLPDFVMEHYTVSPDDKRIVFAAIDDAGRSPVWLATLDGSAPPRRLSTLDAARTVFGAKGEVYFLNRGQETFVYRVSEDGSGLQKAIANPINYFYGVSPDARSIAVYEGRTVQVYPAGGGAPTPVCTAVCGAAGGPNRSITPPAISWSPDGKFLYLNIRRANAIYAVPLPPGRNLPPLPAAGIRSIAEADALPGVRVIREARAYAGADPSVYAFPRVTTQRNIYRISLH